MAWQPQGESEPAVDRPHDLPRGHGCRPDPGRDRAVPGLQPWPQRPHPRADRRLVGAGPERLRAGVPLPRVHRRPARRHGPGPDPLLLAGLGPARQGLREFAARAPDRDGRPAARVDDHPGDDSRRHRRAAARARLPRVLQQARADRAVPGAQRGDPARRGKDAQAPTARRGGRPRRASARHAVLRDAAARRARAQARKRARECDRTPATGRRAARAARSAGSRGRLGARRRGRPGRSPPTGGCRPWVTGRRY